MKSGILVVSAVSLLILAACNSEQETKDAAAASATSTAEKSPTVATVNGVAISKARVDFLLKQGGAHRHEGGEAEARNAIIDQLAMQMVIAEEATKKGLDRSPEVSERLELVRQSVLANAYVQDYMKTNQVSDEALKAEYERIKAGMSGTEYKARHILVEKEADAKDIIAKLKKNVSAFAKLASEKSKDPGSKVKGGDLGWFDPSRMVPEFGAAVGKLEKGKFTTEPVRSQFGFHVILLEDSRPIEAPPLEQVKANLLPQLQQQNLKKQLDALKAKAKIEIVAAAAPAAAASAPTGPVATPAVPAPAAAPASGASSAK